MNRLFKVIPLLALLSLSYFVSAEAADQQYAVKKTTKLTPEQLAQLAAPAGNITTPGVKQGVQPLPPHTATPPPPPPPAPAPETVPDRNFQCEAGYYCKTTNGGFTARCILGNPTILGVPYSADINVRDCNAIANTCRDMQNHPERKVQSFYDTFCKD